MKLSIIIPVYNEEKTLEKILNLVQKVNLGKISKEIIIVNDCSKDNTQKIINKCKLEYSNIISFSHKLNRGKGAAIRTGLNNCSGDIVVIQDADMEYDPNDFKRLIKPILSGKAKAVYGSRFLGHITGSFIKSHYYGNKFLSFVTKVLYGAEITDMETCYKMIASDIIKDLNLQSNRFDIEPEITSKLLRKKYKIIELPINYNARGFEEGKKITWKDGIRAIYILFKCRFFY